MPTGGRSVAGPQPRSVSSLPRLVFDAEGGGCQGARDQRSRHQGSVNAAVGINLNGFSRGGSAGSKSHLFGQVAFGGDQESMCIDAVGRAGYQGEKVFTSLWLQSPGTVLGRVNDSGDHRVCQGLPQHLHIDMVLKYHVVEVIEHGGGNHS